MKVDEELNVTILHLKNKVLKLKIGDFSSGEIDVEDLLQIQINNLIADIITFPVIFNRLALAKAEIDDLLREEQLDFKIFEAQKYEEHKKELTGKGEKATETAIDNAIIRDPQYKIKKTKLFKIQKEADIIDGLYWSAKSKDQKLNAISLKITPEEFDKEVLEGTINTVQIRAQKNSFPTGRK